MRFDIGKNILACLFIVCNTISLPRLWKIFALVYRTPTYTDQYFHYSSHHQTSSKKINVSSLCNRAYSIITNKDDLTKKKL